jgi:hypothetical protein
MLRPSPVPSPTILVVKKGSKIRPMTSAAMPGPVSAKEMTAMPSSRRVSMVIAPRPTMAWAALARRFKKTWSMDDRMHSTCGRSPSFLCTTTRSLRRWLSRVRLDSISSWRSTGCQTSSWLRANTRRSRTIFRARSAPSRMPWVMESRYRSA